MKKEKVFGTRRIMTMTMFSRYHDCVYVEPQDEHEYVLVCSPRH